MNSILQPTTKVLAGCSRPALRSLKAIHEFGEQRTSTEDQPGAFYDDVVVSFQVLPGSPFRRAFGPRSTRSKRPRPQRKSSPKSRSSHDATRPRIRNDMASVHKPVLRNHILVEKLLVRFQLFDFNHRLLEGAEDAMSPFGRARRFIRLSGHDHKNRHRTWLERFFARLFATER